MQHSITLTNDIQQVPQLADFVDIVCEEVGMDMAVAIQMNLAMEEAVVNVMSYAYPADTVGDFDPTTKDEVDTTLSAEERPIGGLGIHLVRQLMDSINYERIDGKNVLTLRKKFDKPPVIQG